MLYINLKDTAKMIRKVLKANYPGTKFSVRGDSYAGGASINVRYDYDAPNAPARRDVDAVLSVFNSRGFDGMIDMAYSKRAYLLADGTVVYGGTSGTTGSGGYVEKVVVDMPEGAQEVRFSSSYVSTY